MNQRIKQLLSEAKIYDGPGSMTQAITTCPQDIQKFAELIVRECAQLVEDNMDPQNAWITPAFIKEHFGVE